MGDWFETVVDPIASPAEAKRLAGLAVAELVRRGVILAERTDCTLGAPGYPPAPEVLAQLKETDELLLSLRTNGLEVCTERSAHICPDLERIGCPLCRQWVTDIEATRWRHAVGEWYEGGRGELACPSCHESASVADWTHAPPCGFAHLAFTFWNWPPFTEAAWQQTPASVIEAVLGRTCVVVYGKL